MKARKEGVTSAFHSILFCTEVIMHKYTRTALRLEVQ